MKYTNGFKAVLLLFLVTFLSRAQVADSIPQHDTFKITSKELAEDRVINVWIPLEYAQTTDSLAVIYMPDGGIKEDFPHVANTLAQLIHDKKIQPVLLVGIENTQRRRDLTGFTEVKSDKKIAAVVGGSAKFRAFIQNELFAQIAQRYRVNEFKTLLGESLAGLFVMETFFESPELFDNYIAFDPSLWWNNQKLKKQAPQHLAQGFKTPKRLWFAGSKAVDIVGVTRELAKILQQSQTPNLRWRYSDEPKEEHWTIFRATKESALIWTLNPPQ